MKAPRDEDGITLKHGDHITFTFGIPPICVTARLVEGDKDWHVTCVHPADVKPKTTTLRDLTKYYQIWKASPERVRAALKTFAEGGE